MKSRAIVFLMLVLSGGLSWVRADVPSGPLVVILLPGTSLTDWRRANAPTLHRILDTGAVAVMNTRTARLPSDRTRETPESAVLTLGAGSRAAGGAEITDFHPAGVPVPGLSATYGELYTRRTGLLPPIPSSVNIQWPRVLRENGTQGYDLLPGNLGDGLAGHGIAVTVGGGPFAAALACSSDGTVTETGDGERFPHRLPPCLVWDAGADAAAADALIAQAASEVIAQHGRLMIVSPSVGDTDYAQGRRLGPVVVWGPGIPTGFLYSPSTHRAGLIANTDVAPSITAYFGAATQDTWLPTAAFGRPWEFRPSPHALAKVAALEEAAYRQSRGMRVLPVVAISLGIVSLLGLLRPRLPGIPQAIFWLPSAAIFALLVSPSPLVAGIWFVALSVVLGVLGMRWDPQCLSSLAGVSVLLMLAADGLTGSRLMQTSLLGYSAVEGARYYGIGNEAMGVMVGSALVAAATFWPVAKFGRICVGTALLGLALLLGLPLAGAKAGGLLVAVGSFAAFLWTAGGKQWRGRVVMSILTGMVLALAITSLGDRLHHGRAQSHMGQAVSRIHEGGPREAVDIILRKLNVERRLLYHSAWAVPLWVSVFGLFAPIFARRTDADARSKALRYGGMAAILTCLAANDAGVVAAALCGVLVLGGCAALGIEKKPAPTA